MYQKLSKVLWILFLSGLGIFALYITSIYYNWGNLYGGMPNLEELENPKTELASELYSADGVLLGKYYRENRSPVAYEDLAPNLLEALKATEDIRFEEHSGIDFTGTLAIIKSILVFDPRGGSTISQQLAKNLFDTRGIKPDPKLVGTLDKNSLVKKISDKFREWILAIRIERAYTKNEIITMYLNTVDFGSNTFGIKAASKTYFGKTPATLDVQESAVLVGLLKAPTFYSPKINPKNSKRRRNTVMKQMVKYGFMAQESYDTLKEPDVDLGSYKVESHNAGLATYFRTEVQKYMQNWCKERGLDLYADGVKIYTTIDSRMQRHAEIALEEHMKFQQSKFFKQWKGKNPWRDKNGHELKGFFENALQKTKHYKALKKKGVKKAAIMKIMNTKRKMKVFTWKNDKLEMDTLFSPIDSLHYYKRFLHAGMMSVDPYTGHIKAWVGGINQRYFQYDHVKKTSRRQPGSTFKPFVYALAIEKLLKHPCNLEQDVPITFQNPADPDNPWTPKNSDGYSGKIMSIRQAMARSINSIAAKMISDLSSDPSTGLEGAQKVADFLNNRLGVEADLVAVPSICLGSSDVSVYEMVGAYAAFVNRGVWIQPTYVTRVEDKDGKILHQFVPKKTEAMSDETAYKMVYMLRGGMDESGGTSLGLNRYDFPKIVQVGGKTGTTSNNSDAWYMGISPHLVTGVWSGAEDRSVHFRYTRDGQGARQAMPAYAKYMDRVYKDPKLGFSNTTEKFTFPRPSSISGGYFECNSKNQSIMQDPEDVDAETDPSDIF